MISKFFKVLAISAGLALVGGAQAATYNFGTLSGTDDVSKTVNGTFADSLVFSIAAANAGDVGVAALTISSTNGFDHFGYTFGAGTTGSYVDNGSGGFTLGAGNYVIDVSGVTKSKGGTYMFSYDVAAVPEPETYAMFLAGLGIMGGIARRRSKA